VVEIAAAPANFAATPLYAAQLPDAEAVQAATVIPPPARPAQPLEDWAGPIRRDLYASGHVTGSAEAWRRLEEGFARERAMAGVVVHASVLAAQEAAAEAKRKAACSIRGVSIAACGARTGRAHSQSSTTSRPSPSLTGLRKKPAAGAHTVELLVQSLVWIAVKAHCTGLAGDFCG
jgi:hypothetical protein